MLSFARNNYYNSASPPRRRRRQLHPMNNMIWTTVDNNHTYYDNYPQLTIGTINDTKSKNFTIPRPNLKFVTDDYRHNQYLPSSPRIDQSFDGNSITDRISEEFQFLDNNRMPLAIVDKSRPVNNKQQPSENTKIEMFYRFMEILGTLLTMLIGIGLLVFGIIRYTQTFTTPIITDRLLDLDTPEKADHISRRDSARLLSLRAGVTCLAPSLLMILSGFIGLFAFIRRYQPLLLAHSLLGMIAVLLWISAIANVGIELNLFHVQLHELSTNDTSLLIAVLVLLAIGILLLPTATAILALKKLLRASLVTTTGTRSIIFIHATLVGVLLATACTVCSLLNATATLTNTDRWTHWTMIGNQSINTQVLYGYGLVESIVDIYILIIALIGFAIACSRSRLLRSVIAMLYALCVLIQLLYILNPDRILAISANLIVIGAINGFDQPIGFLQLLVGMLFQLALALWLIGIIIYTLCVSSIGNQSRQYARPLTVDNAAQLQNNAARTIL